MAKKKSHGGKLPDVQTHINRIRAAIKDGQSELEKLDKAAKAIKKMFERANKSVAKGSKKKS